MKRVLEPNLFSFLLLFCFCPKDLPLPRKNSRWVLLFSSISICLITRVFFSILGEALSVSHQQGFFSRSYIRLAGCLDLFILFGSCENTEGFVEGVVHVWNRKRRRPPEEQLECVRSWLWPAESWGFCPWCWNLSIWHSSLPFVYLLKGVDALELKHTY